MTREAMTTLVASERPKLERTALRQGLGRADAEDAVCEGVVRLVRAYPRLDPRYARSWLFTVVKHVAWAMARRHRSGAVHVRWARWEDMAGDGGLADIERRIDVRHAMRSLRPDHRAALADRALGLSYDESAAARGWTRTKVNRCVSEGRAALRMRAGQH